MKNLLTERVAERVRAEVVRRRVDRAELASALSLSQQAFSRRFIGAVQWSAGDIAILAAHLRVDPAALLPEEPHVEAEAALPDSSGTI